MFRNIKQHAKWMSSLVLTGASLLSAVPAADAAQTSGAKSAPAARQPDRSESPATSSAPAAKSSVKPSTPANDAAAREQILKSPEWHDTVNQFNEWLSSQSLYDADQVKQTRARLEAGIKRMSAAQMQRFMSDMTAKLEVLGDQATRDAQQYLTETLAVASPTYARKVRQQLPDLLSMNATQIEQKLSAITSKRQATAQMQKSFEYARQRQIAFNEERARARVRDQQQQAAERASASTSQPNDFTPAADYYPYSYDAFDSGAGGYAGMIWTIGSYRF